MVPFLLGVLSFLLFLCLAIFVLIFGLYGVIIFYYGRRRSRYKGKSEQSPDVKFEPFVSVVVPTHNEELIISKKIENLLSSSYPMEKLEIIFVDDSNDSTLEIIKDQSKKVSNIVFIGFNRRMGYSPSMIAGCKAAKGEIIVLNDAGSLLDPQAIANLVSWFKDKRIGVVTGKDVILNVNEEVGKSESLYQRFYDFLRTSESEMDSTFYIKGEATAVRSDIVKVLEKSSETFDTTVGLFARQMGYKVVYDPRVRFYEYAPSTHSERVKQKTIRAANLVKVLWRFRHMLFKREYGKYGLIVLPINFMMLAVVPVAIIAWFGLLLTLTFFDLSLGAIIWAVLGSIILSLFIVSRHFVLTFLDLEYSLLKALFQVIFTKKAHDKIDKVISTRRL
jgi:cellulose synthase/poly-beta-1,6-N-acetylglucosamine synthase-like glycosyltransferase